MGMRTSALKPCWMVGTDVVVDHDGLVLQRQRIALHVLDHVLGEGSNPSGRIERRERVRLDVVVAVGQEAPQRPQQGHNVPYGGGRRMVPRQGRRRVQSGPFGRWRASSSSSGRRRPGGHGYTGSPDQGSVLGHVVAHGVQRRVREQHGGPSGSPDHEGTDGAFGVEGAAVFDEQREQGHNATHGPEQDGGTVEANRFEADVVGGHMGIVQKEPSVPSCTGSTPCGFVAGQVNAEAEQAHQGSGIDGFGAAHKDGGVGVGGGFVGSFRVRVQGL